MFLGTHQYSLPIAPRICRLPAGPDAEGLRKLPTAHSPLLGIQSLNAYSVGQADEGDLRVFAFPRVFR